MKRAGEKGEGKWQRISWDEALDTIAISLNITKKVRAAFDRRPRGRLYAERLVWRGGLPIGAITRGRVLLSLSGGF